MDRSAPRRATARARGATVAVGAALLALAAAASPSLAQSDDLALEGIQELTLGAVDYAFDWPDTIEAGRIAVTMDNAGQELHHAQLGRLNEGHTADEALATLQRMFEAELAGDPDAAAAAFAELESIATTAGGPGIIAPGASQRLILDLEPGTYVWFCGLPAVTDGQPHFAKGMVKAFEVVEPGSVVDPPLPAADGTLALQEFAFALPASIPAGPQRWQVSNEGQQPHEILLAQLAPGTSAADFLTAFADPAATEPPPGMPIGGVQAITPGTTVWLDLDLAAGTYAAFCFVPDPGTGQPHVALGMLSEFTVAEAA